MCASVIPLDKRLVFMSSGTSLLAEQIVASFSSPGYSIALARTTAAVRRLLARDVYDLLLIEAQDPQAAYEACRALRLHSRIPIVILNSDPSPLGQLECYDAGADLCLAVPIEIAELMARLRGLLRREEWNRQQDDDQFPAAARR